MEAIKLATPNWGWSELAQIEAAVFEMDGPYAYVERFEQEFAAWLDRKFALMTPNCTSAIHLALATLGISEGDEVIAPECTWIASVAPICYQRAIPVFVDIDPISWCISPKAIRGAITERTKAIIGVDLYGNIANWPLIRSLADERGIFLIEDAAQALGAQMGYIKAGRFGDISVFSFNRTKTFSTGEGGMLLTDSEDVYEEAKILRDHGRRNQDPPYFNWTVGFKYTPSNISAAMGCAQLARIDALLACKREIHARYLEGFKDLPLDINADGCWATTIVFPKGYDKIKIIRYLASKDIPSRPFFYPLSSLPAFKAGLLPDMLHQTQNNVAYSISKRGITLPCAFDLTTEQIEYIVRHIRKLLT